MSDSSTRKSTSAVAEPLALSEELALFHLFSSTLLSTLQINKLLHLILSALVHEGNGLFCRAMLFLYNKKTNTLQGMLGICRSNAAGLRVVARTSEDPLTGHWELDEEIIADQRQSDFCGTVRSTRIDLGEGCQIISQVVNQRRLQQIENVDCSSCRECAFISRFGISSFAAVPLLSHDTLLGVIIVDNPFKHQPITAPQLRVLQLFASQAGMAIENSRLYRGLAEAHAELQETRQRLVHAAHLAAIGEMAASISHELKTPLITIGGFAARLGRMVPDDTPQRHYLDTIINESHRLERLLSDILAFSRKPTICYQPCDLRLVLHECLDDYVTSLAERGIQLQTDFSDGTWMVFGDAGQLKQICINLLVNAQEAMPHGGRLRVSLRRSDEGGRTQAIIAIADSGGGIADDLLEKVFAPFFTTKRHGTGLGLAIVNRIVQNHGGTLAVRNRDNGAEFMITLPLAPLEADLQATAAGMVNTGL